MNRILLFGVTTSGLALSACAEGLPEEREIEYTRVLNIASEVRETPWFEDVESEPSRTEALPFEMVHYRALVASPTGAVPLETLSPIWLACPRSPGTFGLDCWAQEEVEKVADLPECPTSALSEEAMSDAKPCVFGQEEEADLLIPFSPHFLFGGDIEVLLVGGTGLLSSEECADRFFSGDIDLPDTCVYAYRSQKIGPTERLLNLAHELSPEIVEEFIPDFEVVDEKDIPEPDLNLRIRSISAEPLKKDSESGEAMPLNEDGAEIDMRGFDRLRIRIETYEDDYQEFLIPVNEGESFDTVEEGPDMRCHYTTGSVSIEENEGYVADWIWEKTDEDELKAGDRVTLYPTVRDGRYGTDFTWFTLVF